MSALAKICGITSQSQAIATADLGADFIGMNFWPQSKRFLRLTNVYELFELKCSLPGKAELIGVFVNPPEDHEYFDNGALDAIQLHGEETPEFCAALIDRGFRVIKAIQVRDPLSLERIADFSVNDILLDAYHPQARGGTGDVFPWALALRFKELYPGRRLWLAGGLTPDNVAEAVRQVQPYAVDVASGVEDDIPGIKNMSKVEKFIRAAH